MATTDERLIETGPAAEHTPWRGRLRGFRDFGQAISRTHDLDELFGRLKREIANLIKARSMFLALYDEASQTVEVVRQTDFEVELPGGTFPLGTGVTSEVIRTRRARLIRCWSQEASPVELQYLSSTPGIPESARWQLHLRICGMPTGWTRSSSGGSPSPRRSWPAGPMRCWCLMRTVGWCALAMRHASCCVLMRPVSCWGRHWIGSSGGNGHWGHSK